jgi:hypothetical protein
MTMSKALAVRPQVGPSLSHPLRSIVRPTIHPPVARGSTVSADLFAEDDFELGGEFLEVFTLASERISGFVMGSALIGIVWITFSLL